jgi:hypothetical protein
MSDPSLGDPSDTIINDDDVSPNSSGLDPGIETAIIVNVVVWVFIGSLFLFLYCTLFRPARRINKANNSRTEAPKPSLIHWLWRKRNHEAPRNEAARVELGRADREFAAHGEREEERIRVTRTGRGRKRSSFASKLVAILFRKKTEEQNGERINLGPLQPGVMSTSTPTPSSGARNEERQPGVIAKLKKLFMRKEGKGKRKETQGETSKGSYFGPFFWWLKTDVVSAERSNGGDEESLMGMEEEKREGLEVEVKKPAKRSTWGSEAPPAYESLAEDQHHEGN